jgi:peptidoglycan/LPS O-acetylase OafA/YrhL
VAVCLSATAWTILEPGWFKGTKTVYVIAANLTMLPGYLGEPMVDEVHWMLAVELKFYALVWLLLIRGQLRRIETFLYAWIALFILAAFVDVARFVRPIVIYSHRVHFAAGGLSISCTRANGTSYEWSPLRLRSSSMPMRAARRWPDSWMRNG